MPPVEDMSDVCPSDSGLNDELHLTEEPVDTESGAVGKQEGVEQPREEPVPKSNTGTIVMVIGGLGLLITIILLAVLLPRDAESNIPRESNGSGSPPSTPGAPTPTPPAPSLAPVPAPSGPPTKEGYFYDFVTTRGVSTPQSLYDQESPQSKALKWIVYDDPLELEETSSEKDILQRYIPAVLYYSTEGDNWWPDRRLESENDSRKLQLMNFFTISDVCDWNEDGNGIRCDDQGNIIDLQFEDYKLRGTFPAEVGYLSTLTIANFGMYHGVRNIVERGH